MADQEMVSSVLRNWRVLNELIDTMTVAELREALAQETTSQRRKSFMKRLAAKIHQVERRAEIKRIESQVRSRK